MMITVQHPDGSTTRIFVTRYWKCRKCGAVTHFVDHSPIPRPSYKCSCGATDWKRASEADYRRYRNMITERLKRQNESKT